MATFRGSEYLCYDLSQNPIQSSSDEITLSFKTWQRNGLILHTGKSADYVNLALKDGAPEFIQTHVHRVGDAIQSSHPLSSPSPAFNLSQHQGLFQ